MGTTSSHALEINEERKYPGIEDNLNCLRMRYQLKTTPPDLRGADLGAVATLANKPGDDNRIIESGKRKIP
jgi:hypothetical protein